MIRLVAAIGFAVALVGIALHYRAFRAGSRAETEAAFAADQPAQGRLPGLTRLAYLLTLASSVILALTGFGPLLLLARPLSGFSLLAHLAAAPVFAVGLAYLTLMWAYRQRFEPGEWPGLKLLRHDVGDRRESSGRFTFWEKISFWLVILLALPVILSIVLSMFPLFGTDGQVWLLDLHRYGAVLLVMAILVHTYLTIIHGMGPEKNRR